MSTIVYTSDLHGHLELYRAAGEAAVARRADALIFGGDLCPGAPSGRSVHLPTEQPQFLLHQLSPLLAEWKRVRPELRVLAIPGNDDCQTILPALEDLESNGLIENLHRGARTLQDCQLLGLSYVPPTPFQLKDFERWDDFSKPDSDSYSHRGVRSTNTGFIPVENFDSYLDSLPTIEQELERLPVTDAAHTVAVIHTPPFGTHCDVLFDGSHIGSRAVRAWIEKTKPRLTLHGHIHESPKLSRSYWDRIGSTFSINPGCDHIHPHLVFIDLNRLDELEHSLYGKANSGSRAVGD